MNVSLTTELEKFVSAKVGLGPLQLCKRSGQRSAPAA